MKMEIKSRERVMSTFDQLKKKFGDKPKEPLHLPDLIAPCDHCERNTKTKVLFMRQGLGNACDICGRLRREKPHLSQAELHAQRPDKKYGNLSA